MVQEGKQKTIELINSSRKAMLRTSQELEERKRHRKWTTRKETERIMTASEGQRSKQDLGKREGEWKKTTCDVKRNLKRDRVWTKEQGRADFSNKQKTKRRIGRVSFSKSYYPAPPAFLELAGRWRYSMAGMPMSITGSTYPSQSSGILKFPSAINEITEMNI